MDSNGVVVLADISLTKDFGDIKYLRDESVSFDKKSIIVGNNANWKLKWKDVETFEVIESGQFMWIGMAKGCSVQKLRFKIRQDHLWDDVREFTKKRWKKLQHQRQAEEEEDRSPAPTRKVPAKSSNYPFGRQRRGVFGRNQVRAVPFKPLTFQRKSSKETIQNRQASVSYEPSDNDDDDYDNNNNVPQEDNGVVDQPLEHNEDEQIDEVEAEDEQDEQVNQEPEVQMEDSDSKPKPRRPRRLRKLVVKTARDDDSSDGDDLFSPAPLTTPSTQRIVSPAEVFGDDTDLHTPNRHLSKPTNTKGTLSSFFAPRPKSSSSSTESTADKVLNSQSSSRSGSKKDASPKFESNTSFKTMGTKSLAPLKRDDGWLSQIPVQSPVQSEQQSPNKSDTPTTPVSSERAGLYVDSTFKRSHNVDENNNNNDYPTATPKRPRFRRNSLRNGRRFHQLSRDVDDGTDNDKETEMGEGGDENVTDLTETKSRASSPRATWKGLRNMGNTCYLNASLQMLLSVGNFVNALASSGWSGNLTKSIVTVANSLKSSSSPYSRSPDAKPVKIAIDKVTDKFAGYLQRDAHEFLSDLIDQVHSELEAENIKRSEPKDDQEEPSRDESSDGGQISAEDPGNGVGSTTSKSMSVVEGENSTGTKDMSIDGTPSQSPTTVEAATSLPTDDFFRLNLQVQLECTCCGYTRSKEELYRHLSLDIADSNEAEGGDANAIAGNIQTSLERFCQPEEVEIKCEKCKAGNRAVQTLRILSQPKALLLHLKRFVVVESRQSGTKASPDNGDSSDMQTDEKPSTSFSLTFQKNRSRVEIPERLTLDSFRLESDVTDQHYYNLKSIVHHIGNTASSGHYTAHGLRLPIQESEEAAATWVSFDDSVTKETTAEEVVSSIRSQRTAYMLLYVCDD